MNSFQLMELNKKKIKKIKKNKNLKNMQFLPLMEIINLHQNFFIKDIRKKGGNPLWIYTAYERL